MSDGSVIVDGKKVSGRRLSFDGETLSVSSASPVEEVSDILSNDSLSEMASSGWESDVSDEPVDAKVDFVSDDEVCSGHCFETPYGKIYVRTTEPRTVTRKEQICTFVKKNAIPFGVGIVAGALCVGLACLLKDKE